MLNPLSMKNKTILITGATSGIGKEAATMLAAVDANVILAGRNPQKTAAVAQAIQSETGNPHVDYLVADLTSQAEVLRMAMEFRRKYDRLDVLINNAGAIFMRREITVDGLEKTFALNHLAYFLLTNLLLDLLKGSSARIVNVSSEMHRGTHLNFDDLQNEHGFTGTKAYSQSKLANIYFTHALTGHFNGDGVTANSLHPGFVATNFGRSNGGLFDPIFRLAHLAAISPQEGAQTIIYLATSPEVQGVTGEYFIKNKPADSSEISCDMHAARRLWDLSLELTGLPVG